MYHAYSIFQELYTQRKKCDKVYHAYNIYQELYTQRKPRDNIYIQNMRTIYT